MYHLYTSWPSLLFLLNEKGARLKSVQIVFILYISTAKPFSLVRGYIEVKINKYEIWQALTQRTLRCRKYIIGIFNSDAVWRSYFLIRRQSFYGKRAKSLEKIFSSFENAIWSILLMSQETDVQIQTFTNVDWNNLHSCSFEWYKLPICRLQILKMWTLYFYSCPAVGSSLSGTQKVHDF